MVQPGECKVEVKLGEETLCVLAFWRREDGSYSIIGMNDIAGGNFISNKKLYAQYEEGVLAPDVEEEEISSMAALGGRIFVINHVNLRESAEELIEVLQKTANSKIEN